MVNVNMYAEENEDEVRCEFVTHVKKDEFEGVKALMKAFGATVKIIGIDDFKPVSSDIINNPDKVIEEAADMPDISTEISNIITGSDNYVPADTPAETEPETEAAEATEVAETPETPEDPGDSGEFETFPDMPELDDSSDDSNGIPFNEGVIQEAPMPESVPQTPENNPEPVPQTSENNPEPATQVKSVCYSFVPRNTRVTNPADQMPKLQESFINLLKGLGITDYTQDVRKRFVFNATEEQIAEIDSHNYMRV